MPEHIGLLIASARRRIKQVVLAQAAPHSLASQQFWFLIALLEAPGLSQAQLAERVRADAPTASRVLSGLRRRGLIDAAADPRDRRRVRLHLTPAGRRLARDLTATAREIRATVVEGMSDGEQEALRAGLRKVIANLDQLALRTASRPAPRRTRRLP